MYKGCVSPNAVLIVCLIFMVFIIKDILIIAFYNSTKLDTL
jgi:hypothetical protein